MKKWFKKFISIVVTSTLCFSLSATAFAAEGQSILSESERNSLSEVLYGVEMQKERLGLAETNFNNLRLGDPVQTYIYINGIFEPGHVMYPIIDNNDLILWAIENDGKYQITSALVNEVNSKISTNVPFSIVYDQNSSYLYTNDTFTLLGRSSIEDKSRSVLDPTTVTLSDSLETVSLSENTDLKYSVASAKVPVYYECDVDFVSQNPPSDICWAASIACIANYCNGSSLTAISVAKAYYGSNYDQALWFGDAPVILASYGVHYSQLGHVPSADTILGNIKDGYPLGSDWEGYDGSRHATCIYGVNAVAGYIYIMDPEYGFTSATIDSSGYTYTYVSGYSGISLKLIDAMCHNFR